MSKWIGQRGREWARGNLNLAAINHDLPPSSKTNDCFSGNVAGRTSARSYHRGEVNVLYADGHVQFIKDSINPLFWRAITTKGRGRGRLRRRTRMQIVEGRGYRVVSFPGEA